MESFFLCLVLHRFMQGPDHRVAQRPGNVPDSQPVNRQVRMGGPVGRYLFRNSEEQIGILQIPVISVWCQHLIPFFLYNSTYNYEL